MGKKVLAYLIFLAVLTAAAYKFALPMLAEQKAKPAAASAVRTSEPKAAVVASTPVRVEPVFSSGLRENGAIEAVDHVVVRSKVSGRLEQMLVHEGDSVSAGQPVAMIEHKTLEARLAVALADLKVARAQAEQAQVALADAQREADRYEELFRDGYCTEQQLTQRRTALATAKAGLSVAEASAARTRASVEQIRVDINEAVIHAPIDGVVADDYSHTPGEMITGETAIVEIVDMSRLYARVNIPEQDAARIHLGMRASISLVGADKEHSGSVWRIQPIVDESTRTTRVDVMMDDPSFARPGMFASVFFKEKSMENVAVVPKNAVHYKNGGAFLWIMEEGRAKKAPVTPRLEEDNRIAVEESLPEGVRILVSGTENLRDGDKVVDPGVESSQDGASTS